MSIFRISGTRSVNRFLCTTGLVFAVAASRGQAQTTLTSFTASQSGFGYAGAIANGGGGRVIVGQSNTGGVGHVELRNAATGQLITTLNGQSLEKFGASVAGGIDLDHDGVGDVIVGCPVHQSSTNHSAGRVIVFSGAAPFGAIITYDDDANHDNIAGASVASVGDVNGDGFVDFAFGIPQKNVGSLTECGQVKVKSGSDGSNLYNVNGQGNNEGLGLVVGVGDVNGDGKADFACYGPKNANNRGIVRVFSGATGAQIWTRTGAADYDFFGYAMSGAADLDGDGLRDIAITGIGEGLSGVVHFVKGTTGADIATIAGPTPENTNEFGIALAADADLDADGRADVIVGDPIHATVHVYSPKTPGAAPVEIATITGAANSYFGASLANLGDVTNDALTGPGSLLVIIPEFAVGNITNTPAVSVFSSGFYGTPCAGQTANAPDLTLTGNTSPAGPMTLTSRNGSPLGPQAYLVMGTYPANVPIGGTGCSLLVQLATDPVLLGQWDASGNLVVPNLPPPGFSPIKVFVQLLGVQNNQIVQTTNGYVALF